MRYHLGHITLVCICAKFEDLLNTSAVIIKCFELKGMLHQDYQSFQQKQNSQDTVAIGAHYTKGCEGFSGSFKRYCETIQLNFDLCRWQWPSFLDNLVWPLHPSSEAT